MRKRLILAILLLALFLAALFGIKYWQNVQQAAQMAQPQPPATIASTEVREERWRPMLDSVGSLVAINGTAVTTEVAGLVSEIQFESGSRIEAGKVLLQLDDSIDQAALEALRAERHLAEIKFKRAEDLLKRQVMSRSEYDEARASFDAATARVKQQEATIRRKAIRAPFSGRLGIRQINLGQFLEPGQPIVQLQALDPIYVDYTLPERYLPQLSTGQEIRVRVSAFPDKAFNGEITSIESGVDAGTRTIKLRATLDNPEGQLQPGMFAKVKTLEAEDKTVLTVPRTAVSYNPYGDFIYLIKNNDGDKTVVERLQVETGEVRDGYVAILEGVEAGQKVVRTGLVKLRDGMEVKIDNSVELEDDKADSE
ncbi:efflux RND transporter periplasmic adaptor subunit [Thiohalophilus thiocyanatoxydans]|uniref:Membrane fusion protein (Multidrug efflux system) n=1 Tax=Thiohalophilus thiocyanatoxydans TaxID=381308 RepID=A0A4V3H3T6_9GAMM|nr:efflux RND transporter periplasmic adaptor subunit [Thiohalophilus thiocyanatoxydans]TDY00505.1 membrane fusion protein (multidrug efflux system) [Thiohalophilus thiocyanatoxydans]